MNQIRTCVFETQASSYWSKEKAANQITHLQTVKFYDDSLNIAFIEIKLKTAYIILHIIYFIFINKQKSEKNKTFILIVL